MEQFNIFFDSWMSVLRIVVVGTAGYIALVTLMRAGGKRTLAQMNEFDFVITITLGASFGRILTAREVGVVEAITTFATLIVLQYVFSAWYTSSPGFARLVSSSPSLLYYRGSFQTATMRRQHVAENQILAAVREAGAGSMGDVEAVVLESNGRLSVVERAKVGDGAALAPAVES